MTLRKQLLVGSAAAAAAVAVAGTLAIETLRARDRRITLERASEAAITEHEREACEASPNSRRSSASTRAVTESAP